jgi:membrane-bound serine protease (ClpP class)
LEIGVRAVRLYSNLQFPLALLLFTLGIVTLLAEVLLPTGGVLVVISLLFFGIGVSIILARGTTTEAVVALAALAVGLPAAGYVAVATYRRMSIGAELDEGSAPPVAPGLAELESLKNRTGKTVSPMRPSGTVEFDGRRVDAMTEGVMLDAGVWVRCLEVKGGKVLVREMQAPPDLADLTPGASPAVPPPAPPESSLPSKRPADDFDLDLGLDK